jgi:hypothetical protein
MNGIGCGGEDKSHGTNLEMRNSCHVATKLSSLRLDREGAVAISQSITWLSRTESDGFPLLFLGQKNHGIVTQYRTGLRRFNCASRGQESGAR